MFIPQAKEGEFSILYRIGSLYECLSVTYTSSLSFDARKKKIVHCIEEFFVKNFAYQNFWIFVFELSY